MKLLSNSNDEPTTGMSQKPKWIKPELLLVGGQDSEGKPYTPGEYHTSTSPTPNGPS